jgi:hypothetical protein
MSNKSTGTREDSLKERALQVLNLRYLIERDIKGSYRRRIFEHHPDKHPEAEDNPSELEELQNRIKVINQSYELLLNVLRGSQIDLSKYSLLEDTGLVESVLPQNVKPVPLGKTELELWTEKFGKSL